MHFAFENVSLTFSAGAQILRGVSFDLPPSARTAVIGVSGAGKSSLAGLLRRDRDPNEGRVLLDGRDLRDYSRASVLRHLGVILQRPEVFSGTVRENICFGRARGTYSDAEVWRAIDQVRPTLRTRFQMDGLDTLVGKQGMQLSGGEQQSLCVMRALIGSPGFLIIDEATSSLDSETELAVQEGIDAALHQGIGAFIIAHRFSTLRNCNRFVVLRNLNQCRDDEDQIEAQTSSLEELYALSPTFQRLADAQGFVP